MRSKYSKSLARFIKTRGAQNEKERKEIKRALAKAAPEIGRRFPSVIKLSLFGSAAVGPFKDISDVDVIVSGAGAKDFLRLHSFLEKVVMRSVDLISEDDVKPEDLAFLLSKGEVVYEKKKTGE